MNKVTREVFIANDGRAFVGENECRDYERGLTEEKVSTFADNHFDWDYYESMGPESFAKFLIANFDHLKAIIEGD